MRTLWLAVELALSIVILAPTSAWAAGPLASNVHVHVIAPGLSTEAKALAVDLRAYLPMAWAYATWGRGRLTASGAGWLERDVGGSDR